MQGNLSQINLNEILSLATGGKKTGVLKLCRGNETVEVFFDEGHIVHATCPIGEGERAVYYPVTWGEGTFSLLANGTAPATTIEKDSGKILDDLQAMTREWESILEVIPSGQCVFQLADLSEEAGGAITVSHAAWRVLCRVDGRRTVKAIAAALAAPYALTAKTLYQLYKDGLVSLASSGAPATVATVSPVLFARLTAYLTEVMGPIAPFVIRDQIRVLGEPQDKFPQARFEELVGLVSREIPDPKLRNDFEAAISRDLAKPAKI